MPLSFDLEFIDVAENYSPIFGTGTSGTLTSLDNVPIGVSAVPLPATGMMLLAGLGGFVVTRRRQASA